MIKKHETEIADGQTYAELDQDDPRRDTVMNASFLRASLFTSVVAFGVAVLFIAVGIAIYALAGRRPADDPVPAPAPVGTEPEPAVA